MAYFTDSYLKFFKDLSKNNNRDWFHDNKKVYENEVKKPFQNFIADAIVAVGKIDKEIDIQAKDSIFRINRDIRFSKDKTPYKTNNSAIISKYGRKNKEYPGMYIMFSPEKVTMGGGAYMLDKDSLYFLREKIAKNPKAFQKILTNKAFVNCFGEIQGEKNKIIPKEFKATLETCPEIANKQFYYMADLPSKTILRPDLMDVVVENFMAGKELKKYLIDATGLK